MSRQEYKALAMGKAIISSVQMESKKKEVEHAH